MCGQLSPETLHVMPHPGVPAAAALQAPVAARRTKQLEQHGDVREDPYYWLRDDERKDAEVPAPQTAPVPGGRPARQRLAAEGCSGACTLPKVAGTPGMSPAVPDAGCPLCLLLTAVCKAVRLDGGGRRCPEAM